MIYGNKIGGDSSEKTYIITNEDESIMLTAIVVDELTVFDAQCKDVTVGKKFVGDGGVGVGTNTVPMCRVVRGIREIGPGVDVSLVLNAKDELQQDTNMWDYSYLQGFISTKNDPYNPIMIIADDAVYKDGEQVADITKSSDDKAIYFNVKNDSNKVYLLNYFICKEEEQ